MLKLECTMASRSKCWNLSEKGSLIKMSKFEWNGWINKNIKIWRQSWESIKMLKFECWCSNWSKGLHLSEKAIINENVEIWAKKERFNKCLCFKVGIDQNVGICLKTKESIRILKFEDKIGYWSKMLKFEC